MRHIFAMGGGLAAPILAMLLLFIVACNTSKPGQDADTANPDAEAIESTDDVVLNEDEMSDSWDGIIIPIDNDIGPDIDYVYPLGEEDNPNCPLLSKAPFPYVDATGKKHFCRKCDTPTANDPQCVRNLWEELNRKIVEQYPEKECYPYPCQMPPAFSAKKMNNEAEMSVCDILASTPFSSIGTSQHRNMRLEDGVLGFYGHTWAEINGSPVGGSSFYYDIASEKYTKVARGGANQLYGNKRFVFHVGNTIDAKAYIISASLNDDGTWKYEMVYTDDNNRVGFIYPPAVGKNYVFMNVWHVTDDSYEFMYAKIGEWKWQKMGTGIAYNPNMVGNRVVYYGEADTLDGYACDLDKNPKQSSDCRKLNRANETFRWAVLNKENPDLIAYEATTNKDDIVIVDISGSENKYTNLNLSPMTPQTFVMFPDDFQGDHLLYFENYFKDPDQIQRDVRMCFYDLATKKQACAQYQTQGAEYDQLMGEMWSTYVVWQSRAGIVLRDMKCYCDNFGVCPFEEMKKQ